MPPSLVYMALGMESSQGFVMLGKHSQLSSTPMQFSSSWVFVYTSSQRMTAAAFEMKCYFINRADEVAQHLAAFAAEPDC